MKGRTVATAKKYRVDIGHLVGFDLGDTATQKQIEEHGGTVAHLLKLGAISAVTDKQEKEG